MIKVDKINKRFTKGDKILNNISFYINKGDTVAIIGKSGVGKSVLLKHINGLLRPESGNIWVDNILLNEWTVDAVSNYLKNKNLREKFIIEFQKIFLN